MNKIQFETFREIGAYEQSQLTQNEPSVFNDKVLVRTYRVTIEEIEEPREVIETRLKYLWDNCKNHHHWTPLQNEAEKFGIKLTFTK